jgi:hypothetical protein
MNSKKMGGSVHLYKIDMKEFKYCFENKNNITNNINLVKSNICFNNEKKEIKEKLTGKKSLRNIEENIDSNKNSKNNTIIENNKIEEDNKDNQNNINIIKNEKKDNQNIINIIEEDKKEEKNLINNINEIKNEDKKEDNKEDDNRITLREIKPNNGAMTEFDFKFDLIQKIKAGKKNVVPQKVVFKKKFKNDGNIKYSSISSHDFYKKKGYFSATPRNVKTKVAKNLDGQNNNKGKNQNCYIF